MLQLPDASVMEDNEDFNDLEGDAGNDGMPSATRSETYEVRQLCNLAASAYGCSELNSCRVL